jgi:hypothetical protein
MASRDRRSLSLEHVASGRWSLFGVIALSLGVAVACSGESSSPGDDDTGGSGGTAGSTGGASGNAGKGGAGTGGSTGKAGSAGQAATGGTTPGEAGSGGDTGVAGEGGASGGTSGTSGAGGSGGAPDDGPLLDRPVRLEHECSAKTPLTKLGVNPWLSGALGQTSAGTFLARGEASEFVVSDVVISTIDAEGTLGADVPLAAAVDGYLYPPDLVAHAGGLAALWPEGIAAVWQGVAADNSAGLYFAALDASGVVTQERKLTVEGDGGRLSAAKLAGGPDGYVALYTLSSDDYTMHQFELAVLDATGTLVGTPKTLLDGAASVVVGAALAVPGGYAVTYSTHETLDLETESRTYLAFFDAEGNADGDPIPLGELIMEYTNFTQSLLVLGDQLVVAYTQQTGGYENSDIAHAVHLARFDLSTHQAIGDSVALQAPVEDQENTQPKLVAVGDDLGLVWSQGGVIYICAGCMPDNHLEFVVLDGEDLNPVSEVVRLENDEAMGGFILPQIASIGDSLLVTSTLQYHVSGEGAFGSITCTAAP